MSASVTTRVGAALILVAVAQWAAVVATGRSAAGMAAAAQTFLASLDPAQRPLASFEYASEERQRWHFVPNEMFPRKGLPLRAMSAAQQEKAHALLKTGLSQKGYLTATAIVQLEDTLRAIEGSRRFARSPLDYQFTVFGTPGPRTTWGWRVEGHHLSLHFSVVDGRVTATAPAFTGANPAEVREGPAKGTRVLATLEDSGRVLVDMLSPSQRASAIIAETAPTDIVSFNKNDIGPLAPEGLAVAAMTPAQRGALTAVIEAYASLMADDIAAERKASVVGPEFDRVTFGWAGPTTKGAKHYYRVQGPTFLIEYDNTQNDGNHAHAVWRDFRGEFGRDVLREHLRADHASPN